MNKKKLNILVTNDDGYESKGFKSLVWFASRYGNVVGVAPKFVQSGKSAAITMGEALWFEKISSCESENKNRIEIYSFSGTPVDCVKMAMNSIFSIDNKPDILLSGINHGSNASAAAVYSGTLGATQEGTIYDIPSVAFSIDSHSADADFKGVEKYFPTIFENVINHPPQKGIYLNINFPDIPHNEIKGIKFAEQGNGMWIEELDEFKNKHDQTFYMMSGKFLNKDEKGSGDHSIVAKGYISVVPHRVNTTDYEEIVRLSTAWKTN